MATEIQFNVIQCAVWDDLARVLTRFESGWVFRGQACSTQVLSTSLERLDLAPDASRRGNENWFLTEFKKRAHNYLGANQLPDQPGEWLALMQHFGAPTRLLDFTESPYVAAFFAFERPPAPSTQHVSLWAVNTGALMSSLGATALQLGAMGFPREAANAALAASKAPPPPDIKPFESPDDWMVGTVLATRVNEQAVTNTWPLVVSPFYPDKLSDRMAAQQGLFLWPSHADKPFMECLTSAGGDLRAAVVQINIAADQRGRALQQLRRMNITRTSLFPGLDGFAQSFHQLPIRESFESMKRRILLQTLTDRATGRRGVGEQGESPK